MKIEFYKSIEKTPPRDKMIIGVFVCRKQIFIDFCHYDCEEHIWVLHHCSHHCSMEDFEYDPILWTDKKKFKKIIYETMYEEIQEQNHKRK